MNAFSDIHSAKQSKAVVWSTKKGFNRRSLIEKQLKWPAVVMIDFFFKSEINLIHYKRIKIHFLIKHFSRSNIPHPVHFIPPTTYEFQLSPLGCF